MAVYYPRRRTSGTTEMCTEEGSVSHCYAHGTYEISHNAGQCDGGSGRRVLTVRFRVWDVLECRVFGFESLGGLLAVLWSGFEF